ncbi:MAG: hypothetical protein NTU41_05735 [Chloroflexi bacterium]|nr:hypothetical protein [Chloroflexota bacterium]
MKDSEFCIMHAPEHAREMQEARRLGGLRSKREVTIRGAYEFEPLDSVDGIRRLIEVAVLDTLALDNSVARNRTLAYLAQIALRTLEVGELEQRVAMLEQAMKAGRDQSPPAFDGEFQVIDEEDKT